LENALDHFQFFTRQRDRVLDDALRRYDIDVFAHSQSIDGAIRKAMQLLGPRLAHDAPSGV
jgi:hypothetical protein